MKLRNKKTEEIGYLYANKNENYNILDGDDRVLAVYGTLEAVVEEWEDMPDEPKWFWYITTLNGVLSTKYMEDPFTGEEEKKYKELGNYFEAKEEAEKAVEKLKAWKRLKDRGFKFEGIKEDYTRVLQQKPFRNGKRYLQFNKSEDEDWMKENWEDLVLLFGGEE